MLKAISMVLAISLAGCAGSRHAGTATDGTMTAIYSPPVRLGGTGRMIFLPQPRRAPEADAAQAASRSLPAMQPTPAPPQYDCFVPGPWMVFFDMDRSELSGEAKTSLAALLEHERGICGTFDLIIEGHVHAREPGGLSRRRAEVVRRYLKAQHIGVRMTVKDMGSRVPRMPHASTEAAIHNPRVEIHAR